MRYRTALGEVLHDLRKEKKLTLRATSALSTISMGYLSEVERGRKEISSELLDDLARVLGYEVYEVILKTGYLMAGDSIPDTPESLLDNYADSVVLSK
jgi:hypothetical protein